MEKKKKNARRGYETRIKRKKKWPTYYLFVFRRYYFCVKESRHSETIFAKKRYTSIIVARLGFPIDL